MSTIVNMPSADSSKLTSTTGKLPYNKRSLSFDPSLPIRTNCNECPSCKRIKNITEYSHEATPLLASSNNSLIRNFILYDTILMTIFVCILIFAGGIGIYLLFTENEGAIIEEFDYISRDNNWDVNQTMLNIPVSKVLLLELFINCTDIQGCLEYQEYKEENKEKIQIFSGLVLYNFYEDLQGQIFEGKGWNFQSDCGQQAGCADILTIGILEERNVAPSARQIKKLKAFLDYSIMKGVLEACYEILVSHVSARYFDDLAFTLTKMNRRTGECRHYF